MITLGNHTWRRSEIGPYLQTSEQVIRPANFSPLTPGRGLTVRPAADGTLVAVINVLGSLFLSPAISMFELIDQLVAEASEQAQVIVVDVHAEATSEKVALAHWLDGKVTAVLGTHTHVQTSDARVQRGGTAALTDVGMTGPHDSVIGVKANLAIYRMRTGMPVRFETAEGGVRIEGALIDCDDGRPRYGDRAGSRRSLTRTTSNATRTTSRSEDERRRERVELAREIPVARREPELSQRRARPRAAPTRAARGCPATSGTTGTSQIRNCGESTFPSATNATRAAALQRTSSSVVTGRRSQIQTSTAIWTRLNSDRRHCGPRRVAGSASRDRSASRHRARTGGGRRG